MEGIWRELRRRIPVEQVFILSVLFAFIQYCGRSIRREELGDRLTRDRARIHLEDIQGYELRVSAYRLCENIEWAALEDADIQECLWDEVHLFSDYYQGGGTPGELFQLLFRLEKNGMYTFTPDSVQKLIVDLLGIKAVKKMGDFCCAGAGLGLALWERLKVGNGKTVFVGEETDMLLCDVARLNFFAHQVEEGRIVERDVLDPPDISEQGSYDMIVMDVPKGRNITEVYNDRDPRMLYFNKKNIFSDWIYIQDVLYRLGNKGTAAVLVTTGALVRLNEKILRQQLVDRDWLEAVITLPFNLYPRQYTGTELLIFNKNKPCARSGKIIFIDISREYQRDGKNSVEITRYGQDTARKIFMKAQEMKGISAVCGRQELAENDYSLKPLQYIQSEEERELSSDLTLADVAEIVRGAQVARKSDVVEEGNACFINVKDIQENRVHYETADHVSSGNAVCKEKYRIQPDDILVTSKGTALKMAAVEDSPPEAYISGNITMLRIKDGKYDPYVLFEYLKSKQGRMALERIQSGTTIRILSNTSLGRLKIPRFDPEVMKSIGKKLKENQDAYYREEKLLTERFEKERQRLLNELGVSE